MTERFYIPAEGPDVEALNIALYSASILASERDSEIILVVPALKYASGTILNQCITEAALKKLTKGEVLQYQKVPIRMTSLKTLNPYRDNGVILALWAGDKMLSKIDESPDTIGVIALRWVGDDVEKWAKKHGARQLPTKMRS
ncbi:hypothetical protein DD565_01955 [Vibrio cholerae]|uniref:hypothetical protein n=1 Tax=Vibrio cholerae TaxID=666 RepID=UPI000D5CED5E|nr:hypothetical protein [Vibrio cholerae]PVX20239.1 hypothetical protein DD565_01955 [Vibrio cholerae]HDZ9126302.1 hypothetical protein [Vibrio cholerae]